MVQLPCSFAVVTCSKSIASHPIYKLPFSHSISAIGLVPKPHLMNTLSVARVEVFEGLYVAPECL